MSIRVVCAACGAKFRIDDRFANKRIACQQCRAPIKVPEAETELSLAPEPADPPREPPRSSKPQPVPAAFDVHCPGCGKITSGNANLIGKRVRCKQCELVFRVEPDAGPTARPARPPAAKKHRQPDPELRDAARERDLPTLREERPYDVLAGIDDLELAAPRLAIEPLAPLPRGNAKLPPAKKKRTWNDEDDGETLSKVGLVYYLLVVVGLAALAIWAGPWAVLPLAGVLLLGLPHLVCYLIVLFRMARYGNPGLALLCFLTSCIFVGELVALVVAYEDPDKWRLGKLYRVWATLYGLIMGLVITSIAVAVLFPAVRMAGAAAQKARAANAAREQGLAPGTAASGAPTAMPPPTAAPSMVVDSDAVLQILRQLNDNGEKMLTLLRGVADKDAAIRVAPERQSLQAAAAGLRLQMPQKTSFTGERAIQWRELFRKQQQLTADTATEEQRLRQIPGVAPVLGLGPDLSAGPTRRAETAAAGAVKRKDRPAATTPAEQITRALEDLQSGTIFDRREAVKQLRKIEVDPDRQVEVAKALTDLLIDNDHWLREDAAGALETWATSADVPALVRFLQDAGLGDANAKRFAMRALAHLQDPSGAKAITQQLFTRDAPAAIQALKEMGPAAEPAVMTLLDHQDPAVRREMCGVLEEIGTSASIPALRRCAGDRVAGVKDAARSAISAISARQKKSSPGDEVGEKPARRGTPSRRSSDEMLERVPK